MTTETAVAVTENQDRWAAIAAQAVVKGDLAKLSEEEKTEYYAALCRSLGLNPLTRPFEFITLNGKLVLYARRDAADQIRRGAGVTITSLAKEQVGDLLVVTAYGRLPDGREDASTGAVSIKGLTGEALANAMMKAETKAKRRLTLSLVGLGFPTEDEVEDIPAEPEPPVKVSLAERAAAKAAALAAPEPAPEPEAPADDGPSVEEIEAVADEIVDGEVEMSDEEARHAFAAATALVPRETVAETARRTFPGIASSRYTVRHWRALADELGVEL